MPNFHKKMCELLEDNPHMDSQLWKLDKYSQFWKTLWVRRLRFLKRAPFIESKTVSNEA